MNKLLKKTLKILLPVALGGFILYWVYRDFDFARAKEVLLHGTNWGWMLFSLFFGVMSHVFRGWRWKQTLAPLGAYPKSGDCVDTGTKVPSLVHLVTSPWFYVVLFSIIGVLVLLYFLLRMLSFFEKVKGVVLNVWEGVMSLKSVKNIPLFILYTLFIWICYFYHFYITFYCFSFTEHLSFLAGLVMFVGGTFAVIVPTPNGAGSWHFAVITMMMLYGVNATDAGVFALIVHGIQTLLVIVLGIYGWLHLSLVNRSK